MRRLFSVCRTFHCAAGTAVGPIVDVDQEDHYAKAKVRNFFKRIRVSFDDTATIDSVTLSGRTVARAQFTLPVPNTNGLMAVGYGASQGHAEVAAAMHATRLIDAMGYALFTLPSMQRKHAEAARCEGRWATEKFDEVRDVPPVVTGGVQVVPRCEDVQCVHTSATFVASPHAPASIAAYDPNALFRVTRWFEKQMIAFRPVVQEASFVVVTITLPFGPTARGSAKDRNIATGLAAMHAELLMRHHHIPMFDDHDTQQLHEIQLAEAGYNSLVCPPPLTERFDDHTPVDEEYVKIGQHLSLTPHGVVKSAPVTGLDDEFGNLQLTSHSIYVRREGTKCIASFFSAGNVSAVGVGDTPDAAVVACKLHVLAKESSKLPHLRQAGAVELNETSQTPPEITSVESSEVAAQTDEIDAASRVRVNSFLKRTRRSCEVTVDAGDVPMQFKAQLPILLHGRHVVAIGVASTKKDAEAACYVHAERIIDAAGVPMFNLPGLQKRHVERATAAGRWAPLLPADGIPHFLVPPPVCVRGTSDQCAPRVPTESSDWLEYTGECERFIEEQHLFELNHGEGTEIPVSCDHLVDATYELVRQLPIDKSVKSRLMNYCSVMNIDYPTRWTTKVVGTLKQRRVMTETTVPGFEHITARGIGPNKDDAQRRASMHCMELLRCLDPDWSLFAETEAHGPGKRSKRDFGSFDHLQRSFTDEGKQRLVQLFTVCCGLPAPEVDHRQRRDSGKLTYVTTVTITDHAGEKFSGSYAEAGQKANETHAYAALFEQLHVHVPAFKALASIVRAHPHLDPDHVVHVALPDEIRAQIRDFTEVEQSAQSLECEHSALESSIKHLVDATVHDPLKANRASLFLKKRRDLRLQSSKYQTEFRNRRETLSIWQRKEEILSSISSSQVVVLCGTTGCGKTTQVPQYILDDFTDRGVGGDCRIVVTQPRRLNAVSISARIAAERLEEIGDVVGYTIRLESKPGSAINFCTSGVLLRLLQNSPQLEGITHLIIDEIHERDINSDFLLILVKDLIRVRPDLRVVLMSATLQSEAFRNFFGADTPIIQVAGFTYPIQELFLEDLTRLAREEGVDTAWFKLDSFEKLVAKPEERDPALQHGLLEAAADLDYSSLTFAVSHFAVRRVGSGSILVFLPGWDEITKAKESLQQSKVYSTLHILPLHSSVTADDQARCFQPAPEGKVKVILATNIAESGVTIDDVEIVIDAGRAKEKSYITQRGRTVVGRNELSTMSRLVTVMASKANSTQRRGRTGRTRPGKVVRLYPREQVDHLFEFQTPEIHRTPLDALCLQILAMRIGDPQTFLQRALEPPSAVSVTAAMNRLYELGATNDSGRLTVLGQRLAMLPVAPHVAKMILIGASVGCLDSVLTIASCFDTDPFTTQRENRETVKVSKDALAKGSQSDHIANLNAYNTWVNSRMTQSPIEMDRFVSENGLSMSHLTQISKYKLQYREILVQSGFLRSQDLRTVLGCSEAALSTEQKLSHSPITFVRTLADERSVEVFCDRSAASELTCDVGLVKGVISAALYPNVAMFRDKRRFRSKLENNVYPQGTSVAAAIENDEITNPFFVFEELIKASTDQRVLFRGVSNVSFWALLLLGTSTRTQIQFRDDLNLAIVDGWIIFRVDSDTLELVYRLKSQLSRCIERKFQHPTDDENNSRLGALREHLRTLLNVAMKPNELTEAIWSEGGAIVEIDDVPEMHSEQRPKVIVEPEITKGAVRIVSRT
jgi:HrpA-like RNA helicase